MASKAAIVNVALGGWYPAGASRLVKTLRRFDWAVEPMTWINTLPAGAPTHEAGPYQFKTHAMMEAARKHNILIWVDASCWCDRDPSPLIDHIKEHGYYLQANGPMAGEWCCDAALPILGITREESMTIPEISTMVVGLDLSNEMANKFLNDWDYFGEIGAFNGPHTNGVTGRNPGWCSDDPRVKGHRHDQTAASVIAHKLGMIGIPRPRFVAYDADKNANDTTIFISRGM